ncbi:MAG TPA: BrnA antitoxin family protein [Stellaceae bacterium]|nr:BrnA antitoxin family protein [Stellaceae bacterium]
MKHRKADTDWDRLERMTEAEISDAIKRDPDARETTPEFLRRGRVVHPSDRKQSVTIRLDTDVVRFFSAAGPGYQTRINTVLRDYVRRRRTG